MPKKKDAATVLAENMVRVLTERRSLGSDFYPLTLRRLAELTDPTATTEIVQKAAAKKKPFAESIVAVRPKDLDSPVALAEDTEQLAGSSHILEYLLPLICTPSEPTCDIARLKRELSSKLKKPFEAAISQRIETGNLPPGLAVIPVKQKKHLLHWTRYPLPQPPEPPEVIFAENLIKVLQSQRRLGADAYPLSFARLVELTQPNASTKLVNAAITLPAFKEKVLLALTKGGMNSPIALAEDCEVLAESSTLLEATVKVARTDKTRIFSMADLKKSIAPAFRGRFEAAVSQRIDAGSLPSTFGYLLKAGSPQLFLLSDIQTARSSTSSTESKQDMKPEPANVPTAQSLAIVVSNEPPLDFARAFDEAFQQLDSQHGHNFVSLVDLRRAIPADRHTFDAGLQRMRLAGRYTLSAAEGRDGISREENEAGLREHGSLLLYVSRKL